MSPALAFETSLLREFSNRHFGINSINIYCKTKVLTLIYNRANNAFIISITSVQIFLFLYFSNIIGKISFSHIIISL